MTGAGSNDRTCIVNDEVPHRASSTSLTQIKQHRFHHKLHGMADTGFPVAASSDHQGANGSVDNASTAAALMLAASRVSDSNDTLTPSEKEALQKVQDFVRKFRRLPMTATFRHSLDKFEEFIDVRINNSETRYQTKQKKLVKVDENISNCSNAERAKQSAINTLKLRMDGYRRVHSQCRATEVRRSAEKVQNESNCTLAQATFEQSFCNYTRMLSEACDQQTSCRSKAIKIRDKALHELRAEKDELETLTPLDCLIHALNRGASHNKRASMQNCSSRNRNQVHNTPAAAGCFREASEPCQHDWMQREYGAQPWYSTSRMAKCQPCIHSAGSHPSAFIINGFLVLASFALGSTRRV